MTNKQLNDLVIDCLGDYSSKVIEVETGHLDFDYATIEIWDRDVKCREPELTFDLYKWGVFNIKTNGTSILTTAYTIRKWATFVERVDAQIRNEYVQGIKPLEFEVDNDDTI